MNKSKKGLCLLGLLLILGLLCACQPKEAQLRFGTAGAGGNYYAWGNVLAQLLEEKAAIQVDVKTTAGSAANLRLLQQGFLQLAIAQSDTLQDAAGGQGDFAGAPLAGYSAVAGLYTEACQLVVAADSDIFTVADLAGQRVSVGAEDSGVTRNAERLLQANGLTLDMLGEVSRLSFADSAAALAEGQIDAFFCTASAPTTAVAELAREQDIRLISLDERAVAQLLSLYDCYIECTVPAGTYQGQEADVQTIGVKAVLLASDQLADDTVKQILATLFDNAASVQYATNFDTLPELGMATEAVPIPFHPGAAAYYAEQGRQVAVGGGGAVTAVSAGQDAS